MRDRIEQMILSGRYEPGMRLAQQQLAGEFGVSQGMIREVLLELKAFGLVEIKEHIGAFVTCLNTRKLLEACEIREMLEGLAARLCCEHASRAEIRELEEMAEKMQELVARGKKKEKTIIDRRFHQRIIELSDNEMLIQLAKSYQILGKSVKIRRDEEITGDTHMALIEPIKQGLGDEAERLMREHIRSGKDRRQEMIKNGTAVLKWIEQMEKEQ